MGGLTIDNSCAPLALFHSPSFGNHCYHRVKGNQVIKNNQQRRKQMTDTTPSVLTPSASGTRQSSGTKDLMRFEVEKKSVGVALFLCWVLGGFGAHRFYLGRPHAATMLIITLLSIPLCFVIIGFFSLAAVWIWMIVDLFSVSNWVKEYNTVLLGKIESGQY